MPAGDRPRLLVVTPYSIEPMIHGGAVRIGNLLRRASRWAEVWILVFIGGTDDPEQRRLLERYCTRVLFQQTPEPPAGATGVPAADRLLSPAVLDRLRALVGAHRIDLVHLEYSEAGALLEACRPARVVLSEIDLAFVSNRRRAALGFAAPEVTDALLRLEIASAAAADQVHVMSEADARVLGRHLPDGRRRIRVIPNGVDTEHFAPPPESSPRSGVLFLGSFPHLPNVDALRFLMDEVWPEVRRRRPGATLTVAGARPTGEVLALDGRDGVRVVGEVEDPAELYRTHRALVVPLRAGSGTRLKVLEALACGLPVVSTRLGVEGIRTRRWWNVLLADRPGALARQVVRLLDDDRLVARLGRRGRRLAVARYGWDTIAAQLQSAHAELGLRRSASPTTPATQAARISVVVPIGGADHRLAESLPLLRRQQVEAEVEIICAGALDPASSALALEHGVVCVPMSGGCRADRLNAGVAGATGRVIAFLGPRTLPADEHWLARLTGPLYMPLAPSATAGAAPASPDELRPLAAAFAARWGGAALSLDNAAVRRDVWEAFPIPATALLDEQRWQRMLAASHHLVLACPEARVDAPAPASPSEDLLRAWRELEAAAV